MSTRTVGTPDTLAGLAVTAVAELFGHRHPEEIERLRVDLALWIDDNPWIPPAHAIEAWYRAKIA